MAYILLTLSAISVALFTAVVLEFMGFFGTTKGFQVDGKTVLITGGSQGMGREVAKLLASKGANVVIVARDKVKLADALQYISNAAKSPETQRFNAISADVTIPEENERILLQVTAWNHGQPPDVVWQIAGASTPGLFIETSLETLRKQMDLNYWGATYLAHATLKAWTKPGSNGRNGQGVRQLIMTSSTAALCGVAGYTPYSPCKAAMRSLADNLRSELNLYNGSRRSTDPSISSQAPEKDISIHMILPGTITSPGLANENLHKHAVTRILEAGDPAQSEDAVAKAAVAGLERGEYLITTQWLGHAMRAGMMGGSPRNGVVVDTLFAWLVGFVYLFVVPDMEGKVWRYGREKGVVSVRENGEGGMQGSCSTVNLVKASCLTFCVSARKLIPETVAAASFTWFHKMCRRITPGLVLTFLATSQTATSEQTQVQTPRLCLFTTLPHASSYHIITCPAYLHS